MELVETIRIARDNNQLELAKTLSGPTRKQKSVNLDEINKLDEKKVLVIGKVLSEGNLDKKISIAALGFSEQAKEKIKKAGCEMTSIKEEIKKNPELKGVKIL